MQIKPQDMVTPALSVRYSPYTCFKCQGGMMAPAIEEGEPEYTEHFVCQKCSFHDTIPSLAVIASQMFTAMLGIGVCFYLFLEHASYLNSSEALSTELVLQHLLLMSISALFIAGFVYVLYQSFKGSIKRRSYTSRPAQTPPPVGPA